MPKAEMPVCPSAGRRADGQTCLLGCLKIGWLDGWQPIQRVTGVRPASTIKPAGLPED